MVTRRSQTDMPRLALPRDADRSEAIVWGFAIGLACIFALGQILTVLAAAPAAIAFHSEAGGTPWFVVAASSAGWFGLLLSLIILDALILGGCLWLARRYWIGFAYLPPVLYLGTGTLILWLLLSQAVAWAVLRA